MLSELARALIHANNTHHKVPLKLKMAPKNRKASGLLLADASMNCGTKEG
jgi:hypothetical protein